MENLKLKEKLKILDLEEKEVDVYLAILSLGKSTITDISRKSAIKRTTIYSYLENLLKTGLIFKTVSKKRVFYSPGDPKTIKNIFEKQKSDIETKKEQFNSIIPELESLYSTAFKRPRISFYEGKDGLREVYWEIMDTHKTIYSIFSPDNFFNLFSEAENHKLMMTLYNNGGILRSLVEKTEKPRAELKKKEYQKFLKSKDLPDGFHFETDLLVVDDTVALISFKNLVGIIIKDGAIASLQKNLIKTMWNA